MLRSQYTGNTNSNLATIRKHLTNRKLGTTLSACLYSDGSVRVNYYTSKKQVALNAFKAAVEAIVRDAGVAVKDIRYRSTIEKDNFPFPAWYTRTAILSFK